MVTALAPRTTPSINAEEARIRVLRLFRAALREARRAVRAYPLDVPVHEVRHRIREEFEQNKNISNLSAIDGLILRGTMDLLETHNIWKQTSHVYRFISPQKSTTLPENYVINNNTELSQLSFSSSSLSSLVPNTKSPSLFLSKFLSRK